MVVLGTIFWLVLGIQYDINNKFNKYCDEKYGVDNWTAISADRINISFQLKYYTGVIWTCEGKQ